MGEKLSMKVKFVLETHDRLQIISLTDHYTNYTFLLKLAHSYFFFS